MGEENMSRNFNDAEKIFKDWLKYHYVLSL